MKIMFFSTDNNIISGAFRSMVKLCSILKNEYKHEILVVIPCKGNGVELLEKNGIQYSFVKSYSWIGPQHRTKIMTLKIFIKQLLNYFAIIKLIRLANQERIECIHINTLYSCVGAKVALALNIPYIWHIREMLEEDQNNTCYSSRMDKYLKKAKYLIAISQCVLDKYAVYSPYNTLLIPNGIDENEYYTPRQDVLKKNKISIISIGNMESNKGQDLLIEAINILVNKNIKNIHVNFVGFGKKIDIFRDMIKAYQLEDFFTFHGMQSDVKQFYLDNDIAIMSSTCEAFGRTTVEAMMSGLLVIGSNSGATPYILNDGNCGLLYECGNYHDLSNKIEYAINNRIECSIIAKAGQDFSVKKFTASNNARLIDNIYKQILE